MILQDLTNKDIFETLINSGATDDEMSEWIIELLDRLSPECKIETTLYIMKKLGVME